MKTEQEILLECFGSLKKIIGLLKIELFDLNSKVTSKKEIEKDEVDELMRTTILFAKIQYLEFYIKISSFLYEKVKDNNTSDKDFYFYLPLLRTLIEIYATVLYLANQDIKRQMTLVAVNKLFGLANLQLKEFPSKGIDDEYNETYLWYKPFIDREGLTIPSDIKAVSKKWLNNSGYDYPQVTERLNSTLIQHSSPQVNKVSKNKTDPYFIYKHLSGYVHGNPLNVAHHGNERFWVTGETLVCSAYLAETISNKVLSGSKHKDIKKWVAEATSTYSNYVALWTSKSEQIDLQN